VFLPQHVKVTPIYDNDHVLRAHVCVACRVDDGSGAADIASGTEITPRKLMQPRYENYDVMRDSNKVLQQVTPFVPHWTALPWKPMMVTIVFTGTERGLDLWFETNLRFWRTALRERTLHDGTPIFPKDLVDANGTAHRGFLNMFCKGRQSDDGNSMWDQIRGALTWDGETEPDLLMQPQVNIWLLGHSLGGALATLTATAIAAVGQRHAAHAVTGATSGPIIFLVTVGCPRVFDNKAAKGFEQLTTIRALRYVLPMDIVPTLPWKCKYFNFDGTWYQHVGHTQELRHPSLTTPFWEFANPFNWRCDPISAAVRLHSVNEYTHAVRWEDMESKYICPRYSSLGIRTAPRLPASLNPDVFDVGPDVFDFECPERVSVGRVENDATAGIDPNP